MPDPCALCSDAGGVSVWRDDALRVVRIDDSDYPGFLRVIWNAHVREMSDLVPAERAHLFDVVLDVERVLRELVRPDKINLASLGNMTPHLHWHVIP
ncbi:MAG: HIT domain-containing protein, partial [Proteobacteria bacterium]|nr:HIT domain-containing protein [Burkholderiales bacterium]